MWKAYSLSYLHRNRSAGLSVRMAALISSLLLSLFCGLFYHAWKYEIERIEQEKGSWHSRLIGELAEEDREIIKHFAKVSDAVVHPKEAEGTETTIDIYFKDKNFVFSDTPLIAEQVGIAPENIVYNHELLAMYLIRHSEDPAPRLLFPMFILITLAASFSLIVIIHNAFAVTMNARIHQLGILSSIGATPKQIRSCLLQEAAALCAIPVIAGNLLGIAGNKGLLQMINVLLGNSIPGRHKSVFSYHPLVLALTLLVTIITIWISAWLPARKLSKCTPLEAMKTAGELPLTRRKNTYLLPLLFGIEGELAGNALNTQRKALRTASLSFTFSFLAFTVMQCFFCLSGISTKETYFERYQEVWDIMVTVNHADVDTFAETEAIQKLAGIESAIVYQKAAAKRMIAEEELSEEMKSFGGFSHASANDVTQVEGGWLVNAPIIILDDNSFSVYCAQIGIPPRLDGAVLFNQIRDVTNPDFRHPEFMPYVTGETAASLLRQTGNEEITAEIPVLAYTEKTPVLREEYATLDYYELVHFIPASLWKEINEPIGGTEENICICIRGKEVVTVKELNALQDEIEQLIGGKYTIACENRIQEYEINNRKIQGMMAIFGSFCLLLAIIGIGNVFSNTLGFVYQRKREFARYMSVGLTPKEHRKMFCIEALVIAGRPILISLPLAIIVVGCLLRMSYLEVRVFLAEAPWVPVILFMLAIFGSVALAYYLAWKSVGKINLAEVLGDDTMM